MVLDLNNIGDNVGHLDDEVLEDDVAVERVRFSIAPQNRKERSQLVVGVLGTGNGDVADLSKDLRDDDVSQVGDQMRLVGDTAIAVVEQHLDCLLDILAQLLVEGILVVSVGELLD